MSGWESGSRVELLGLVSAQAATIAELTATVTAQAERIADLEQRLGQNSRNSSRPPSVALDTPPRSLRKKTGRRPGKQPGSPGAALRRVDDPDEVVEHVPSSCTGCGVDLAEATAAARWAVPDTIAAVLVTPQCAEGLSRNLGPEALVAAHNGAVVALVPAPETSSARTALAASVVGRRAIVGPARPSRQASVSLRLATLAARLADSGVLSADPVFVDEHLATLVVHRDPELVAELVARRLAALEQVRDATRDRLAETLLAWLVHRGQRQPIAEALHVHPQPSDTG